MRWKGIITSGVLLAIVVAIHHHVDPLGTDVGLMVVGPIVGGITLWQHVKYWLMSPERRAQMMAEAIARRAARSRA